MFKSLIIPFFIVLSAFSCTKSVTSEDVEQTKKVSDQRFVSSGSEDYFNEDFDLLVKKYEDPNRLSWQNPELILNKLKPLSNMKVADIGVGTGFFTFRIVQEAQKVIAIDIENRFLEYIEDRKYELRDSEVTQKIETRLCHKNDPLLKKNEVDIALMVNTYHFLDGRVSYLNKVREGLTDRGRITIVDYKEGIIPVGPPESLRVPLDSTIYELKLSGFKILDIDTTSLEFQYIVSGVSNF